MPLTTTRSYEAGLSIMSALVGFSIAAVCIPSEKMMAANVLPSVLLVKSFITLPVTVPSIPISTVVCGIAAHTFPVPSSSWTYV